MMALTPEELLSALRAMTATDEWRCDWPGCDDGYEGNRYCRKCHGEPIRLSEIIPVNPQGPQAADTIERLQTRVEELEAEIAGRPGGLSSQATEPVPVSAVPASIPDAGDVRLLSAGPDPRGGFTFSFADANENGFVHLLAAHMYEMLGVGTEHELNCVQIEVRPRDCAQAYSLTLQREGGKLPLALKGEAVRLLQQALEAIESGRSEPLFIMRDAIRNWLADDITAQAIEARRAETTKIGSVHESAVGNADAPNGDHP